eukprot:3976512-Pyramimonas_sp.AAC.1
MAPTCLERGTRKDCASRVDGLPNPSGYEDNLGACESVESQLGELSLRRAFSTLEGSLRMPVSAADRSVGWILGGAARVSNTGGNHARKFREGNFL